MAMRTHQQDLLLVHNKPYHNKTLVCSVFLQEQVAGLANRDQMAIVAAGESLVRVCGLTSPYANTVRPNGQRVSLLEESLRAIRPSQGSARMKDAAHMARRILADHPGGEILIITMAFFMTLVESG